MMKDVVVKRRKPYRYSYRDIASRILATIPETVSVFIPSPFENNSLNKYYLLSCRYLHPELNLVCVDMIDRYVPITSKEIYMTYLGMIHPATYRKFIYEAMDINLLAIIQGKNGKDYFMINPVYASHRALDFNPLTKIFTATSRFSGEIEIDEKYITGKIKADSDKRMDM